jgi:putative ABC transport system permease protein
VRRHLGRRGLGLLIALVTAVTSFALVGGSRLTSRAVDDALGAQLRSAPAVDTDLVLRREPTVNSFDARDYRHTEAGDLDGVSAPFDTVTENALEILGPTFRENLQSATHRAESNYTLVSPASPETSLAVETPQLVLVLQSGLTDRVVWTEGRAPRTTDRVVRLADDPGGPRVSRPLLEVALADETARQWGLQLGDRLRLDPNPDSEDRSALVVLVGTFDAVDRTDPFWTRDRMLLKTAAIPTDDGGSVRRADAVVGDDAYSDLSNTLLPVPKSAGLAEGAPSGSLTQSWDLRPDPESLRSEDVDPLVAGIGRLNTSRSELTSFPPYPQVTTGLLDELETYERDVAVTRSILSIVAAAVLVLSLLVLALTAHVLVERRRDALRLLRSRGASLAQLWAVIGLEVLAWALPAGALGAATGLLVSGTTGLLPLVGVVLAVLVPLTVALVATRSSVRHLTASSVRVGGDGGIPRVTAEVLLLSLAALAVSSAQQRGQGVSAGQTDPFIALTPVLLALAVGVVVARLEPAPVRWAAALAARGRGAIGFLGMARAARERAVALVPLVALLLATATGLLMVTVTTSADRERTLTSWRAVGADARVDYQRLDPADVDEISAQADVTDVVPAFRTDGGTLVGEGQSSGSLVTVIAVDPEGYAALLADTPLAFDAAPLDTPPGSTGADTDPNAPVPALLSSPDPAMGGGARISAGGRSVPIDVVAIDGALRRGAGTEELVVLMPLDALRTADPTVQPTTAYVGTEPGTTLTRDPLSSPLLLDVRDRGTWLNDVTGQPLPSVVREVFAAGAVVAVVDSVLAVLLLLTLTASGRRQALLRLRTMGLRRGRERRLAAYEVVPLVLAALVPGVALGLVLPSVVHDVLDLAAFTGGPPYPPITADPWWTLGIVLAVGAVVLVGLAVDAARARHAGLAQGLRQGDRDDA